VVLAVDVYGKGIRPSSPKEAGELAGKYKSDRVLMRERMQAAYQELIKMHEVNPKKILVMGYCFGGTAALELARTGAKLSGTAVFHGGLSTPMPATKALAGKTLVLHGADDPNVPPAEVDAFKDEMKTTKSKLEFIAYPGAVHAFTNPNAGDDPKKGAAYNQAADQKSWKRFQKFLKEVL
jgi:dienelactone hydrolase